MDWLKSKFAFPPPLPGTGFHPFPRLPPELRLIVWSFSFTPRVVYVMEPELLITKRKRRNEYSACPPILHVSREARSVALKHYSAYKSASSMMVPWNYYYNPEVDILSFPFYGLDGWIAEWPPTTLINTYGGVPPNSPPDPENLLITVKPLLWAPYERPMRALRENLPKLKNLLVCVDADHEEWLAGGCTGVVDMTADEVDAVSPKVISYLSKVVPIMTSTIEGSDGTVRVRLVKCVMLPRRKGLVERIMDSQMPKKD